MGYEVRTSLAQKELAEMNERTIVDVRECRDKISLLMFCIECLSGGRKGVNLFTM